MIFKDEIISINDQLSHVTTSKENTNHYHLYHLYNTIVKDIIDSKNDNMTTTAVVKKKFFNSFLIFEYDKEHLYKSEYVQLIRTLELMSE